MQADSLNTKSKSRAVLLPQTLFFGLVAIFLGISDCGFSQIKQIGNAIVKNYSKQEYGAGRQNWDIVQQSNGMLYFANNMGILQFDGLFWNEYKMPNNSIVRSLAVDSADIVYVGASNEFGFLRPNNRGKLQYHSLSQKLPPESRNFGEVWKTYFSPQGVYFQTFNSVFLYKKGQVHVLAQGKDLGLSFLLRDTLYVRDKASQELLMFRGTSQNRRKLTNWPAGMRINALLPYDKQRLLVASSSRLFFLQNGALEKWSFPNAALLSKNRIFSACPLGEKYFAFGTVLGGLVVIDKSGRLLQHIERRKNLQDNTVLCTFEDRYGKLWLGLDNGISEIEIHSPFTFFDWGVNLNGAGYAAQIHQNRLYLATNQGVQFAPWPTQHAHFQFIENLKGQAWELKEIDQTLFCGHDQGTFVIEETQTRKISNIQGCWNFQKIPGKKDLIISGTYAGLQVIQKNAAGEWQFSHQIKNFTESARFLAFDQDKTIWVSHGYKGVFHLFPNQDFTKIEKVKFYDKTKGLPGNFANTLFKLNNRLAVATLNGIYEYNPKTDRFNKSDFFNKFFKGLPVFKPHKDPQGNIWFNHDNKFSLLEKQPDGSYILRDNVLEKFHAQLVNGFEYIYLFDSSNVFIGTENGFLHYNPKIEATPQADFRVFIRQTLFLSPNDTIEYDLSFLPKDRQQQLTSNTHSLKFMFSASFLEQPEKTMFQFRLKNFDKNWSNWTRNNQKEYTNLQPGDYTFEIRAKNIYGQISPTQSFQFSIPPPWYRTLWALTGYIIFGLAIAFGASFYLMRRIEKDKKILEKKQQEELEKRDRAHKQEALLAEQEIIKLRNEKLQAEIERKNTEFDLKKKELASVALQITHKNEILNQMKKSLAEISEKVTREVQKDMKNIIKSIEEETKIDEDWEQFKKHFDQVHGSFFKRLRKQYSNLTPKDLKLCAYLRMNLSTKEIAPLMNISVRGVEISRYRLRKKLGIESNENLIDFMLNL